MQTTTVRAREVREWDEIVRDDEVGEAWVYSVSMVGRRSDPVEGERITLVLGAIDRLAFDLPADAPVIVIAPTLRERQAAWDAAHLAQP